MPGAAMSVPEPGLRRRDVSHQARAFQDVEVMDIFTPCREDYAPSGSRPDDPAANDRRLPPPPRLG